MEKKDCYHCLKLRLRTNRCSETREIIKEVHTYCCEFFKNDRWMVQQELEEELIKEKGDQ